MPINFERLDAAITYAAEHPAEFAMDMWYWDRPECGTTACLAGTVVNLETGWEPVWREVRDDDTREAYRVRRGGDVREVGDLAAELLGVDGTCGTRDIFHVDDLGAVIEFRNSWARKAGIPERTWSTS